MRLKSVLFHIVSIFFKKHARSRHALPQRSLPQGILRRTGPAARAALVRVNATLREPTGRVWRRGAIERGRGAEEVQEAAGQVEDGAGGGQELVARVLQGVATDSVLPRHRRARYLIYPRVDRRFFPFSRLPFLPVLLIVNTPPALPTSPSFYLSLSFFFWVLGVSLC